MTPQMGKIPMPTTEPANHWHLKSELSVNVESGFFWSEISVKWLAIGKSSPQGHSNLHSGMVGIPSNNHQEVQIYQPYFVILVQAEFHGV